MSRALSFGPEVAELVREIAARPDSVLFRAAPDAYASMDADIVRPTDTGLSSAERHLLAVYREEAAFALRDLAWSRLANHTSNGDRLILTHTVSTSAPPPQPARAASEASRVLRETPHDLLTDESRELLGAGVRAQQATLRHVVQLCAASQRIAPTWNARMMTAQSLLFEGRGHAALATATRALRSATNSQADGITWHLIAEITARGDNVRYTQAALRHSMQAHPQFLSCHVATIWTSIRQDAAEAAETGCRALADLIDRAPQAIDEQVHHFESLAATKRASLTPESDRLMRRLVDRSPLAGRLFHALCH